MQNWVGSSGSVCGHLLLRFVWAHQVGLVDSSKCRQRERMINAKLKFWRLVLQRFLSQKARSQWKALERLDFVLIDFFLDKKHIWWRSMHAVFIILDLVVWAQREMSCSIPRIILLSLSHALSLFYSMYSDPRVCLFDFKLFLLLDTKEQCAVCSQILNVWNTLFKI